MKSKPIIQEAVAILSEAISKRLFTLFVARCRVDYQGRSSSKLDWGERVVMVKPDGSVLVHRKMGYDAVNWQPPGAFFTVSLRDGDLLLRADRWNPRESLTITSSEVLFVSAFSLVDDAVFDMLLTEEDLYRVLIDHPDLIERGFRISEQQKGLGSGKADLTGYDKDGRYTVVEVKKVPAGTDAVKQLFKYVAEMRETSPDVRAILVAPSIQASAKKLTSSLSIDYHPIDLKKCVEILISKQSRGIENLDKHLENPDR